MANNEMKCRMCDNVLWPALTGPAYFVWGIGEKDGLCLDCLRKLVALIDEATEERALLEGLRKIAAGETAAPKKPLQTIESMPVSVSELFKKHGQLIDVTPTITWSENSVPPINP